MMMIAAMVLAFALRAHSCTLCGLPCPESCFTALAADGCPTVNAGNGNNNDDVPLACGSMISALQDAGDSNLKNVFASVVNTACADTGGAGKLERALAAQSNGSRKKCDSPRAFSLACAQSPAGCGGQVQEVRPHRITRSKPRKPCRRLRRPRRLRPCRRPMTCSVFLGSRRRPDSSRAGNSASTHAHEATLFRFFCQYSIANESEMVLGG